MKFQLWAVMRFFLIAVSLAVLAACGQKGQLYLRDSPPAGVKAPKPAPAKAEPYPAEPVQSPAPR
jgi:predicted small lipoprotein YifL